MLLCLVIAGHVGWYFLAGWLAGRLAGKLTGCCLTAEQAALLSKLHCCVSCIAVNSILLLLLLLLSFSPFHTWTQNFLSCYSRVYDWLAARLVGCLTVRLNLWQPSNTVVSIWC